MRVRTTSSSPHISKVNNWLALYIADHGIVAKLEGQQQFKEYCMCWQNYFVTRSKLGENRMDWVVKKFFGKPIVNRWKKDIKLK